LTIRALFLEIQIFFLPASVGRTGASKLRRKAVVQQNHWSGISFRALNDSLLH
jgi:hypothetical protein